MKRGEMQESDSEAMKRCLERSLLASWLPAGTHAEELPRITPMNANSGRALVTLVSHPWRLVERCLHWRGFA